MFLNPSFSAWLSGAKANLKALAPFTFNPHRRLGVAAGIDVRRGGGLAKVIPWVSPLPPRL